MAKQVGARAPGRAHRTGISILELGERFPDEAAATAWFEKGRWPDGVRRCPKCDSEDTYETRNRKPMPFRCRTCRGYFPVRTGTVIEKSRLPLLKWVYAIYRVNTSIEGVSSMELHRWLGVSQKTAWYMIHRLREGWPLLEGEAGFEGEIEIDEAYIGGLEKNRHERKKLWAGTGPVGKTAVLGMRERSGRVFAMPIPDTKRATVGEVVEAVVEPGATIHPDESGSYAGLGEAYRHEQVCHTAFEYVRGRVHTNGIESFRALLKRGIYGVFHHVSTKHLHRYVGEFTGRLNARDLDTVDQMRRLARSLVGKRLPYSELIAWNLRSGGRRAGRRRERGALCTSLLPGGSAMALPDAAAADPRGVAAGSVAAHPRWCDRQPWEKLTSLRAHDARCPTAGLIALATSFERRPPSS